MDNNLRRMLRAELMKELMSLYEAMKPLTHKVLLPDCDWNMIIRYNNLERQVNKLLVQYASLI